MPKPNAKKRRVNRVKGFASRGRGKKWILLLLVVLLLIPAMQVAVVRFVNPPRTLPMLIDQGSAMFSKGPKAPLRYRWIDLPQIPEMFLEHLSISEDQHSPDFEGRRLLGQSALPGTRRLFAEMISRMDRVKCFASRGLVVLS